MYVGLKQPRGDGKRYVTPARAATKETNFLQASNHSLPQNGSLLRNQYYFIAANYDKQLD